MSGEVETSTIIQGEQMLLDKSVHHQFPDNTALFWTGQEKPQPELSASQWPE